MEKDILTGEAPPPTSEDVHIRTPPSSTQFLYLGLLTVATLFCFFLFQHFVMKVPGYIDLPMSGAIPILTRVGIVTIVAYGVFTLYGFLISLYGSYSACGKQDTTVALQQGALFAVNPMISYLFIRLSSAVRVHYDRVIGAGTVWSIAAFMSTWIVYSAISLLDESKRQACKPTDDEATKFKKALLEKQAIRKSEGAGPPAALN